MKLAYSIPGSIWWIQNFLDYNMYKGIGWDKFQLDGSAHDCVIC